MDDGKVVFFDIGETLVRRNLAGEHEWQPGAEQLIDELGGSGYRLGVISNTGALTRDELEDLLPATFSFDRFEPALVVLSSEVGVEKPDLRIFFTALAAGRVEPQRCCFVGENLEEQRLEFVIGLVHLVDQEHAAVLFAQRLQERARLEEFFGEKDVTEFVEPVDGLGKPFGAGEDLIEGLLQHLRIQKLLAVLPLINGFCLVEAFIAL